MNVFEWWAVNAVYTPGKSYGYKRDESSISYWNSDSEQNGAIDVIAVRRVDGTLCCSPFHVKIGNGRKRTQHRQTNKANSGAVDTKDKGIVKLRRVVSKGNETEDDAKFVSMKVGAAGEAFFVQKLPRHSSTNIGSKDFEREKVVKFNNVQDDLFFK